MSARLGLATEKACAAWHRAADAGIQVIEGETHLYILGPSGSEPAARELRAAPEGLVHRLIAHGCDCGLSVDAAAFSIRERARLLILRGQVRAGERN